MTLEAWRLGGLRLWRWCDMLLPGRTCISKRKISALGLQYMGQTPHESQPVMPV